MVRIKGAVTAVFTVKGKRMELKVPDEFVGFTSQITTEIKVHDSDVVFVGYGIVAPEYGWDDFKDVNVRGKTIVVLINDPPVPDPNDPSKLDENPLYPLYHTLADINIDGVNPWG